MVVLGWARGNEAGINEMQFFPCGNDSLVAEKKICKKIILVWCENGAGSCIELYAEQ